MAASNMPAAEHDVDVDLVRGLIAQQFPDLASFDVSLLAYGWDNVVFRIGSELVARLPRRVAAVPLTVNEQRWLPSLAPRLPLPVPVPLRVGTPGLGYPWPWSICPWMPGEMAARHPPADMVAAAKTLGSFLAALHVEAPADGPVNPIRGGPLEQRSQLFERGLVALGDRVDRRDLDRRWQDALELPRWDRPLAWVHGDLHPANLLVAEGRLSGVIDFGDLTRGDPATDLSVAWMLFASSAREEFRISTGHDENTWNRGRAWALTLSVSFLANSADHPLVARIGADTLAAVLADGGS